MNFMNSNHNLESSKPVKAETEPNLFDQIGELGYETDILGALDKELRQHGFGGSTDIPKLVYLSAYTALFDDPVSLLIKGPSGSGKSYALHAGLRYLPQEAYVEFHGMSEKALAYAGELDLRHKVLVIQEAAGRAEGNGMVFLRQLLTEGGLSYLTVAQTPQGHVGKELPSVKGPVGLFMTTTANRIHHEDETRMLSFHVDQSREQIRAALKAQANGGPKKPSEESLKRWHALYRFVQEDGLDVRIPFWDKLIDLLPDTHPRVLRDVPKVRSLTSAHALLHRQQRGHPVTANLEDFKAVYDLVAGPLSHGLQRSVPVHIQETVNAVEKLQVMGKTPISNTNIADFLGRDSGTVSRNLHEAINQGYVVNDNPGKGRESRLRLGNRKIVSDGFLPTPEELERHLRNPGRILPVS
mgnify:CR=1 FL=1